MKNKILRQLSWQNLKAHRQTLVPFVLSSAILSGLLYLIISLVNNDYVIRRHEVLQTLMVMAGVLTTIFTAIFIIYASLFIYKQRHKEIGLFSVLGMSKKHIQKMTRLELLIQWLLTLVLAIPGGYLFGHLVFIFLNRLMQDTGFQYMNYPFDLTAMLAVIIITGLIFLTVYGIHHFKVQVANPIQLIQEAKASGKEPNNNFLALIVGLIMVGFGYYLAMTSAGLVQSLYRIFVAVLLVIVGSYFLLGSLSIFILKGLKNNDSYYYKAENFLSLSGMLYRMKASAISLTSISILCTGLMIMLGMTLTAYRGMEDQVDQALEADYHVSYYNFDNQDQKDFNGIVDNIVADLNQELAIESVRTYCSSQIFFELKGREFRPLDIDKSSPQNAGQANIFRQEDFNAAFDENIQVNNQQIGLVANAERWNQFDQVIFAGQSYEVVPLPDHGMGNIAIDFMQIVLPPNLSFEAASQAYPRYALDDQEPLPLVVGQHANIDGQSDQADQAGIEESLANLQARYGVDTTSRFGASQIIYAVNGGALFLGILVSVVLLVGVFLIIYFKQISEGQQDRDNYQIMQAVGLGQQTIKKAINKQIIWLFLLPLLVAITHMAVSSTIIFNILGLINVRDWGQFITSYLLVIVFFSLVYGFIYWLTSRTYYQIVSQSK